MAGKEKRTFGLILLDRTLEDIPEGGALAFILIYIDEQAGPRFQRLLDVNIFSRCTTNFPVRAVHPKNST